MGTIANKQPRGWIVAIRPKACCRERCSVCKPWKPTYEGAVFANKDTAMRKAGLYRARTGMNIRVLREGIVK